MVDFCRRWMTYQHGHIETRNDTERFDMTYIPELRPSDQIRMIYPSLGVDMLTRTNHHGVCGRNIAQWRFTWVGVRHPYRDGESVCGASEGDGYGTREMEEESRCAIVECFFGFSSVTNITSYFSVQCMM